MIWIQARQLNDQSVDIMDKILSITDRLKEKKRKRHDEIYRLKMKAVLKTVQCASCQLSCGMCGAHVESADMTCPGISYPSKPNLCEICRAEYEDFLKMTKGNKGSDIFWHNRQWMRLWLSWTEFHKAIKEFRDSKEFMEMTKDFES